MHRIKPEIPSPTSNYKTQQPKIEKTSMSITALAEAASCLGSAPPLQHRVHASCPYHHLLTHTCSVFADAQWRISTRRARDSGLHFGLSLPRLDSQTPSHSDSPLPKSRRTPTRKTRRPCLHYRGLKLELSREDIDEIEGAVPFDLGFPNNFAYGSGKASHYQQVWLLGMAGTFDYVPETKPIPPYKGE